MMLSNLVATARCLLLDFDGPICSVFAGYPAAAVAQELLDLVRVRRNGELPPTIAVLNTDPLHILSLVDALGDDHLTRAVADACRDAELFAAATASPTPGAEEVLRRAAGTGRSVAIVSNNASAAVETYLKSQNLSRYVDGVAARFDGMPPHQLKPHPFLIERGLAITQILPADTVFIGDSVTDIEAGKVAGTSTIGYANKPRKRERLSAAGATVVIDSMWPLLEALMPLSPGSSG